MAVPYPSANEGGIDVLARGEHDVPEEATVGVLVVAGWVAITPDGRARKAARSVGGRGAQEHFSSPRQARTATRRYAFGMSIRSISHVFLPTS